MAEFLTPEDFNDGLVADVSLLEPVMEQAMQVNPDQHALDMKISRKTGFDVEVVKAQRSTLERDLRMQEFNLNTFGETPATEAFYSDLAKASLSHDDVENLSALERTLTPIASIAQAIFSMEEGALRIPGFLEDTAALSAQGYEAMGLPKAVNPIRGVEMILGGVRKAADPYTDSFQKTRKILPELANPFNRVMGMNTKGDKAFEDALTGEFKPLMEVLTDPEAVSTYGANAVPSLLVALASGGSLPVIMGTEGGGELVEQADFQTEKGKAIPLEQKVQATIQTAVINGMLEKVGVDYLRKFPQFKKFFKEADDAGVNVADIFKAGIAEGGTELLQQFNQNIAQLLSYDPEQSLTSGMLQSFVGGAGAGTSVGGVGYASGLQYKKAEAAAFDVKNNVDAKGQTVIDEMNYYASKSATRGRDKDTFREFVQSIDAESQVYIDGEQVQKYMQEKTKQEIADDPALQMLQKKMDEAKTLGADIGIPVADFATDIAGSEHFNALREHMKIDPEGVTPAQQVKVEADAKTYVEGLMTEAKMNVSQYAEAQDIFASVRDQLIDTGRVTPQQAGVMADIVPAWATVQAVQRGIPVAQVYEESELTIAGPMTGKMDALSAEALKQSIGIKKINSFKTDEGMFSVYDIDKDHRRADMFTVHEDKGGFIVRNVLIPEEMRRTGIATTTYRAINQESLKKTKRPLRSTQPRILTSGQTVHELSADGVALWDSFVAKGLAEKRGEKDYIFTEPLQSSAAFAQADLYVAHNLTADNLRHVAEIGGLAAPSLAVGRTGTGTFDNFGEITLLADKSILESPKARTFDADVYTPRHQRAVYTIDGDKFRAMLRKLEAETAEAGQLEMPSLDDIQQRGPENMLYSTAMRYYFLKEKGKAPKAKPAKASPFVKKAAKLGLRGVYTIENSPEFAKMLRKHLESELAQMKTNPELEATAAAIRTDWFNEDGTVTARTLRDSAWDVDIYLAQNGVDSFAMRADIDKAFRNQKLSEEYKSYVTAQFNSIKTGAKLFKGFTYSGNRKYIDYTLENVVKEMTRQVQGGEGMNYGAGSLRAMYATEMKTVKQVQARREQIINKADFEKIKEESQNKVIEALDALRPYYKFDSKGYGYADDASSAIAEGIKGQREAFNLDADSSKIIKDLVTYLRTLPTEYFETKIGRAVQLSEFNTAVVPKDTPADVMKLLTDAGVTVKKYKDGEDRARIVAEQQHLLFQQARGYYDPSQSLIRLTEASDLSTFLHEFAHFMYDMEKKNPDSKFVEKIHQWFKRNAESVAQEANGYMGMEGKPIEQPGAITAADVVSYLDNKTSGDKGKDAAIERAVHEQFARGFETYLMEGKAPSVELHNVFRTFARWLTQVYKSVRGDLKVNLDAEMRDVFARMLATDEQIAAAEARARFAPMFTTAAMVGMTDEEYTEYKKKQEAVRDKATETLRDKLIAQLTRQTKAWWKEEKADIAATEMERLKSTKVYRAIDALRNGNIKLDTAAVKENYSEVRTDKLGRKMTHVNAALTGMTAAGGNGMHPDQAAALLGYGSGDEMIQDIIAAPKIGQLAEDNAQQQMLDKHGDILTDGTIEREADEAFQNEERGKLILDELKVLSRGTKRGALDRSILKSLAEDNIGKLTFREIQPGKYRAAEVRAAQESAAMLAAGNKEGAATAKARQALNYYLGMAAAAAKNDTVKIVDRMARYRKADVREAIQKAGNGYWGQLNKILERFEFRKSATMKQVDEANESLRVWMKARIEEDGDALVLSAAVQDEGYAKHWKNIPYDELVGINDSVKNIEHVARYSNRITRMQEEVDFQQLVQRWTDSMNAKAGDKFISQRTDVADGRKWGRWAMAQMTKVPYLASWLDGGERAGISHDILVQPFTDAYDQEVRMWAQTGRPVMDAIQNRSKEDIKRHNKKLFVPEIKEGRNDGNLYGHQVIAVALNTGNAGNLKKMLLGEGWANPDNDAEITFDNPKLQAVLKHMTRSDWELVQLIWNQMDTLYPQLAEVHRRTTGLTPPKVEAVPFVVEVNGEKIKMQGGYYPVKYDPNRSFKAEQREDRLNAQTESMFGTMGIQASVNASATNERTGYYAPIRLSLDVVPNHLQETIHFITHHDAVRETNKLLRNAAVAETIKAKLGPEEFAQLKPWLNDIAKDGREAPMKTYWGSILQRLRFGMTLGVMGFKVSTGLMQVLGLSNTVAEVGSANVYQAVRSILGSTDDMKNAWEFAITNSKVMSHRAETMDREIKNAMQQIEGKRGFLAAAQEVSMKHIAYIQTYIVDLPSWHAAYIKGMKQWGDEKRAYQYADWVVENIQGSGVTKDMAAIMRNQTQEARMFTMFMTFFSSLWNIQRDTVRGAASGYYSKSTVAAKAMFLFTIPVFLEMLLRGDWGDDDDDKSDMQKYLTNLALYPAASVPFVRDVAAGIIGDYGYNISPVAQLMEQGTNSIPKLIAAPFTDDEITKSQVKGSVKFIGAAAGIPGVGQAWATGEHLNEVLSDGEELTLKELMYGPDKK